MKRSVRDPLMVVRVISALEGSINRLGLTVESSSDFHALRAARLEARGDDVSPMFDPAIADLGPDQGFWLRLTNDKGETIGLGAYRIDAVNTHLADWALGWMIGHYVKRGELIVPEERRPPANSRTELLNGQIVYYGELWHHESVRRQGLLELFPRFGLLLCYLKWNPDAIWGLANTTLSRRGGVVRIGFPRLERSFLRWKWAPKDADHSEWISIAQREDLEFIAADEWSRANPQAGAAIP